MKIMQIVSCLELIVDNLFIFIHKGGIEKVTIQPPRKNGTFFFFFCESLSKGYNGLNEFMIQSHMRFYATQWSATRFYGSLSV